MVFIHVILHISLGVIPHSYLHVILQISPRQASVSQQLWLFADCYWARRLRSPPVTQMTGNPDLQRSIIIIVIIIVIVIVVVFVAIVVVAIINVFFLSNLNKNIDKIIYGNWSIVIDCFSPILCLLQITGVTFPRVSILIITTSQEMTGYIRFLGIPTLHFSAGTCHSNQGDQDLVTAESRLSHGCAFLLWCLRVSWVLNAQAEWLQVFLSPSSQTFFTHELALKSRTSVSQYWYSVGLLYRVTPGSLSVRVFTTRVTNVKNRSQHKTCPPSLQVQNSLQIHDWKYYQNTEK